MVFFSYAANVFNTRDHYARFITFSSTKNRRKLDFSRRSRRIKEKIVSRVRRATFFSPKIKRVAPFPSEITADYMRQSRRPEALRVVFPFFGNSAIDVVFDFPDYFFENGKVNKNGSRLVKWRPVQISRDVLRACIIFRLRFSWKKPE